MAEFGSELLSLVGTVAPTIASALGGPLAGMATRAICSAIGLPQDAKPADLKAALALPTADQLVALKQADDTFKAQMRQLDVDLARISQTDTASARARQVAMPQDYTPPVLACALSFGFFGLVYLMVFHGVPAENQQPVNILLGTLGTGWVQSIAYYFGSSYGSKAKDAMLFQSVPASSSDLDQRRAPSPGPGIAVAAAGGVAHAN